MFCKVCGAQVNASRYCRRCGSPVGLIDPKPPVPSAPKTAASYQQVQALCINCENPLTNGLSVCLRCGHMVGAAFIPKLCQKCRTVVKAGWPRCRMCSARNPHYIPPKPVEPPDYCKHCGKMKPSEAMHCPKCGMSTNVDETGWGTFCMKCGKERASGARFCRACGRTFPPEQLAADSPAPQQPQRELCQNCSTPKVNEASYCGNCGAAYNPISQPQVTVCSCGRRLGNAKFCGGCGKSVS